jgi:hypothetical protein
MSYACFRALSLYSAGNDGPTISPSSESEGISAGVLVLAAPDFSVSTQSVFPGGGVIADLDLDLVLLFRLSLSSSESSLFPRSSSEYSFLLFSLRLRRRRSSASESVESDSDEYRRCRFDFDFLLFFLDFCSGSLRVSLSSRRERGV